MQAGGARGAPVPDPLPEGPPFAGWQDRNDPHRAPSRDAPGQATSSEALRRLEERVGVLEGSGAPSQTRSRRGPEAIALAQEKEEDRAIRTLYLVRSALLLRCCRTNANLQCTQAASRAVLKDAFSISQYADFTAHVPATDRDVEEYARGRGGPDPNDLRFQLSHTKTSSWNKKVIQILVAKLNEKKHVEFGRLPSRSEEYVLDLFAGQYKHMRELWSAAQRKEINGTMESYAEAEARQNKDDSVKLRKARQDARRKTVSLLSTLALTRPDDRLICRSTASGSKLSQG